MWHSRSKSQKIRASIKASRKWLKVILALGVRNFDRSSVALKLVEFPLFDNFFLNLAKFWDLDIFLLSDFPNLDYFLDFLICSTSFSLTLNLLTSLLSSFFLEAGLLLLFLLKANLLLLLLLKASLSDDPVVFSIKISKAAILLKLWMNY